MKREKDLPKKAERIRAVKGTRDIVPPESQLWHRTEEVCRGVLEAYNYREIRTPVLEETELFARSVGAHTDIVSKEMYTFADRDGRSLTLRPEATASVVRAYLDSGAWNEGGIKKYYYLGPMFRRERPQKGRYRQFYQIGAEVLGSGHPAVDVEILEMLHLLLERLNLRGSDLLLNSVGCRRCRPEYIRVLRASLEPMASQLCSDCQRRIMTNPMRVLDCKIESDQAKIESLPKISDSWCRDCARHFQEVTSQLTARGLKFKLAPRLVRGLDYYTRTTFEITYGGLGSQNALLGGGRYDGLSELIGGPPVEGLGFAIGEDRFLMAVEQSAAQAPESGPEIYVAWVGKRAREEGLRAARQLRVEGFPTEIHHEPLTFRKSLARANKMSARWTVILGEDEVARGVFQVKDMQTGRQEEIAAVRLVEYFVEKRRGGFDRTSNLLVSKK